MQVSLASALDAVREALVADDLARAVASGRQRAAAPVWRKVEVRPVVVKGIRCLQVTTFDETQAFATNYLPADLPAALDRLLAEPYGNWHVDTASEQLQVRVTKKGDAMVHRSAAAPVVAAAGVGVSAAGFAAGLAGAPAAAHDRVKAHLIAADAPLWRALGVADERGVIKPSRRAKLKQVEEFVRLLAAGLSEAHAGGRLRTPSVEDPWRVVDLGCGNAYLTFAALTYLGESWPVRAVGIDVKQQSREHNTQVAQALGLAAEFVVGSISEAALPPGFERPDVVLALHACDTATDEALARAVEWQAPLVLAAPCCHHDLARQLKTATVPAAYTMITRHGILRERLADTLTDAMRATLMRTQGYRVEVMEFVESAHTPRNTLLRAVRSGAPAGPALEEYSALIGEWGVTPALAVALHVEAVR